MKSIEERAREYVPDTLNENIVVSSQVLVYMQRGAYMAGAVEQQAIDEEVRLKKSDDMTKAEYDRETAFADWYLKNGKSTPTYSDAIEWARKQTIDEVCNWLGNYFVWEHEVLTKAGYESVINELRKAMEE